MSNVRPNNLERKRLREICRDLLTQHISKMPYSAAVNLSANATIEERTGISVKPSEVRLLTSRDDGYSWKYLTEVEHLFSRNISKHSIGAYRELCAGLGKKFEAVPSVISSSELSSQPSHIFPLEPIGEVEVSFSSRITQLATEIDNLRQKLSEVYEQLITETSLRETTEKKLKAVAEENHFLQEQARECKRKADYLENCALMHAEGIEKVLLLLEGLRTQSNSVERVVNYCPLVEGQVSVSDQNERQYDSGMGETGVFIEYQDEL